MKTRTAPMIKRRIISLILLWALGVLPGERAVSSSALAAKTTATALSGAAVVPAYPDCPESVPLPVNAPYCLHRVLPGDTVRAIAKHYGLTPSALMQANQEPHTPGQKRQTHRNQLRASDRIRIPLPPVAPSSPTSEETADPAPDRPAEQPLTFPVSQAPATPPPPPHNPEPEPPPSVPQLLALASGGVISLALIGLFLVRMGSSRPALPLPLAPTARQETAQLALFSEPSPAAKPKEERTLMDVRIAIQYWSTPKGEDSLQSASNERVYLQVLTDGARACRSRGGELSGGGGAAARIAAREAITYLMDQAQSCLAPEEMLARLESCFSVVNAALARHNSQAPIPGATTLILAALWQTGDGRWYWVYGNIGNGWLSLIHTTQLLSGWPVETPLLSKQTNGLTTITLPGCERHGFQPSVGLRPHRPGEILLMASDGLNHLDVVTKQCDRLTFANYLWQQLRSDPSKLTTTLAGMPEGRQDAPWRNALALDDTTIGILWA